MMQTDLEEEEDIDISSTSSRYVYFWVMHGQIVGVC